MHWLQMLSGEQVRHASFKSDLPAAS